MTSARELGPPYPKPLRGDVAGGDPTLRHHERQRQRPVHPPHHLDQSTRDRGPDLEVREPRFACCHELAAGVDDDLGGDQRVVDLPDYACQLGLPAPGLQEPRNRHLHAAKPIQRERPLELARRRGNVGADENEPVPLARPLAVEVIGPENLRRGDASARPHEGRPRAVEEPLALFLRREQPQHEDLQVRIGGRVEHHRPSTARSREDLRDALGTALAEVREAHAQDLRGRKLPPGLLLDPRLEVRGAVPEAVV
jgi:hypothetical protein